MPNLKLIGLRLKSVTNIQKITQSMKMVSAAKFAKAERDLKAARPLGEAAQAFYKTAEVRQSCHVLTLSLMFTVVQIKSDNAQPKELYVALTSDRGLAGAVHSSICKNIRQTLHDKVAAGESLDNVKILCVGDKSRAFMARFFPKQLIMVGSEIGRLPPTFNDAAKIANAIMTCGHEFDSGKLLYNYYKSVVSYDTTEIPIFSQGRKTSRSLTVVFNLLFSIAEAVTGAEKVSVYDSLDADVVQSYMEYSLASLIYYALKEGATSEQSSRMTAMDNSSKNAGMRIVWILLK